MKLPSQAENVARAVSSCTFPVQLKVTYVERFTCLVAAKSISIGDDTPGHAHSTMVTGVLGCFEPLTDLASEGRRTPNNAYICLIQNWTKLGPSGPITWGNFRTKWLQDGLKKSSWWITMFRQIIGQAGWLDHVSDISGVT